MKNEEVNKSLSPEETSVLSNIQSMIGELLQMGKAGDMTKEENPEKPAIEGEQEKMDVATKEANPKKKVKKEIMNTQAENSDTASDDTEDRMEDQLTELTEENIGEVAKSIAMLLKATKKSNVKKSENNPVFAALSDLTKVVKQVADNQQELSNCQAGLLEGLGITEQLKIAKSEDKSGTPIIASNNAETIAFINTLKEIVNKSEKKEDEKESHSAIVNKALSDVNVLSAMLTPKKRF